MNTNLSRYQVYLDPHDVVILDRLSKKLKVKRSQIIREATHAVATRYMELMQTLIMPKSLPNPLEDLIGTEVSKTGKVGLDVDTIYRHD